MKPTIQIIKRMKGVGSKKPFALVRINNGPLTVKYL
jgi:hypothetical protein